MNYSISNAIFQEMSSPYCPFLAHPKFSNIKYLIPESGTTTDNRLYFTTPDSQNDTILVPYPSYLHFNRPDAEIDTGYRVLFMVMKLGPGRAWTINLGIFLL
jgi:hypothetical protein